MWATCTKAVGAEIIDLSIRPPFFFCFFFSGFAFSLLDFLEGDLTFFANVFASFSAVKTKAIIHCFSKISSLEMRTIWANLRLPERNGTCRDLLYIRSPHRARVPISRHDYYLNEPS